MQAEERLKDFVRDYDNYMPYHNEQLISISLKVLKRNVKDIEEVLNRLEEARKYIYDNSELPLFSEGNLCSLKFNGNIIKLLKILGEE